MTDAPAGAASDQGAWLTVYPDRLRHNAAELRRRFGRELIWVAKGDGYGLGVQAVTSALSAAGERRFAVGSAVECAIVLASAPDADVIVLRPELGFDVTPVADKRASVAVGRHTLAALEESPTMARVRIQIEVDCGIGRGGVPVVDLLDVIAWARTHDRLEITGLVAHLPQAVTGTEQRARTFDLLRRAEEAVNAPVSMGGSDALRWSDEAPAHWPVRVGRAVCGVAPRWLATHDLRPAWAWTCRAYPLTPSRSTGYQSRDLGLGVPVHLGVGFADGLPLQAAGLWPVLVADQPYQIVEVFMLSSVALPLAGAAAVTGPAEALLSGETRNGIVAIRAIADALGMPTTAILTAPRLIARVE